jgi:hypothetical protein
MTYGSLTAYLLGFNGYQVTQLSLPGQWHCLPLRRTWVKQGACRSVAVKLYRKERQLNTSISLSASIDKRTYNSL